MEDKNKKFYKKGSLPVKGTKLSLKTRPYINGTIFNPEDPISSFQSYLITVRQILGDYEIMSKVPGISFATNTSHIDTSVLNAAKMLIDFLIQSPTEITMKKQELDIGAIVDLTGGNNNE